MSTELDQAPVIVDVNIDSQQVLLYTTLAVLGSRLWAPDISCDESGWTVSGHSNKNFGHGLTLICELELRIHFWTGTESVTQPLLLTFH